MSNNNMTRFEVQKILRSAIVTAFSDLSLTGWGCMEFANASFQKANKIVLMNLARIHRVGWQSPKDVVSNNIISHQERWMECQTWQLNVICKRDSTTTDSSILAEDVANSLVAWMNGAGLQFFRSKGMSINWIDNSSILVYNDNSDLYQKRVVIPVGINVPKMIVSSQPEMEFAGGDVRQI